MLKQCRDTYQLDGGGEKGTQRSHAREIESALEVLAVQDLPDLQLSEGAQVATPHSPHTPPLLVHQLVLEVLLHQHAADRVVRVQRTFSRATHDAHVHGRVVDELEGLLVRWHEQLSMISMTCAYSQRPLIEPLRQLLLQTLRQRLHLRDLSVHYAHMPSLTLTQHHALGLCVADEGQGAGEVRVRGEGDGDGRTAHLDLLGDLPVQDVNHLVAVLQTARHRVLHSHATSDRTAMQYPVRMIRLFSFPAIFSSTMRDVPLSIIAGEHRITHGGIALNSVASHYT